MAGGLSRGEDVGLGYVTWNFFSYQMLPIGKVFIFRCRSCLLVGKSPSWPPQEQLFVHEVSSLSHPGSSSTPLAPAEELRLTTSDFSRSVQYLPGGVWAQIPFFQGTNYSSEFPWLEIPPSAAPRCPKIKSFPGRLPSWHLLNQKPSS